MCNFLRVNDFHKNNKVTVYSKDPEGTVDQLNEKGYSPTLNTEHEKKAYMEVRKKTLRSALTLAAVILLISLIEIYLMLRASFLSRIKEVGTLRAIGLKKSDIYKKFAGEIIAINLITSAIGIGAMYYILSNVIKVSDSFASNYAWSGSENNSEVYELLIQKLGVPTLTVVLYSPSEIIVERLRSRNKNDSDISKAEKSEIIYKRMIEFCKTKNLPFIVIDTSNLKPQAVVEKIIKELSLNGRIK